MEKMVGTISRRVNPGGVKEVTVRPFGLDKIEIIIPAPIRTNSTERRKSSAARARSSS